MEASIDERHLKDFIRLLQCASKFGDELCISANKDSWEMAVTNSTKSAYCLFKLQPRFFSRWKALGSPRAQRRGVQCQLLVKSVLAVLGKASAVNTIERLDLKIHDPEETLRVARRDDSTGGSGSATTSASRTSVDGTHDTEEMEQDEEQNRSRQSVLVLRLLCKHGIQKKHSLYLAHSEFMRAEVDPNSTPSGFSVPAKTLRDWLDHFSLSTGSAPVNIHGVRLDNQLGWLFGKNEVRIKSWEGTSKGLCTELKLEAAEFGTDVEGYDRYWLEAEGDRVDLTIPMKEFSAALQLADALNIDLAIAFSQPGQPLTMIYTGTEEDDFDIFCAIATTTCEAFTGVQLKKPTQDGGGGGGGGGIGGGVGGGGGGSMARAPSGDGRFPPGISRDAAASRRIRSDITDIDPGPNGPEPLQNGAGPPQAEGSSSAAPRNAPPRGQTPSRSKAKGRLDLTPARETMRGSQGSQRPYQSGGNSSAGVGGSRANETDLFLPGPSQEEQFHDTMSQALGLEPGDEDAFMNALDDAEDEDYEVEVAAKAQKAGNGSKGKAKQADEMELDEEEEEAAEREAQQKSEEEKKRVEEEEDAARQHALSQETRRGPISSKGKGSPSKQPLSEFEADEDIFSELLRDEAAAASSKKSKAGDDTNGISRANARSGPSRSRTTNHDALRTPGPAQRDLTRSASSNDARSASRPSRVPDTERPTRSTMTGSHESDASPPRPDQYQGGSPTKRRASTSRPASDARARQGTSGSRSRSRSKSRERRPSRSDADRRGDATDDADDGRGRRSGSQRQGGGRAGHAPAPNAHDRNKSRERSDGGRRSRSSSRARQPSRSSSHRRAGNDGSLHVTHNDDEDMDELGPDHGEDGDAGDDEFDATQHNSQFNGGASSTSSRSFVKLVPDDDD